MVGERGGNACEICFQKVIPPTLPTSPTLVSGQAWFPVLKVYTPATGDKPHCFILIFFNACIPGGRGTPLQEANMDVPLDGVAFSRLD